MTIEKFTERMKSKMVAERAKNLSNEEIERCLGNCVAANKLISRAKELRDKGEFSWDKDLKVRISKLTY